MIFLIILVVCLGAFVAVSNYYVIPRKDMINTSDCPQRYVISGENRIDTQKGNECAAFSSAYIQRHFGFETDGNEIYKVIPRKLFDWGVAPRGILKFLRRNGFSVCFCKGNSDTLKAQLNKGIPVVVLIRVFANRRFLHYVPVVAYDEEFFYLAESLDYLRNSDETYFNRKIEYSEFERLWRTWVPLYKDTYFVVSREGCKQIIG